jgi:hypothetical protein
MPVLVDVVIVVVVDVAVVNITVSGDILYSPRYCQPGIMHRFGPKKHITSISYGSEAASPAD